MPTPTTPTPSSTPTLAPRGAWPTQPPAMTTTLSDRTPGGLVAGVIQNVAGATGLAVSNVGVPALTQDPWSTTIAWALNLGANVFKVPKVINEHLYLIPFMLIAGTVLSYVFVSQDGAQVFKTAVNSTVQALINYPSVKATILRGVLPATPAVTSNAGIGPFDISSVLARRA